MTAQDIGSKDTEQFLREATIEERIGAALIGFADATPQFLEGLRLALRLAAEDGWEQIAPAWLRRYRQN